jgi:serine/threonine-protein kinase
MAPFFSPDGQWVAFFTIGQLKKVSMQAGAAIPLSNGGLGSGGSWGEDGNIVATFSASGGLWRIPSGGGPATSICELAPGEVAFRWPQILPGGKAVLFTAFHSFTSGSGSIEVITLADRRRKTLQRSGTFGRFIPSGHLVYVQNGTLFAAPFDPDRLELRGTTGPVLEEVASEGQYGSAQFDFSGKSSDRGILLYRRARIAGRVVTVQWLDDTGKALPLLARPGEYVNLRLSPDGSLLALASAGDIWVYQPLRETMTAVTQEFGADYPIWTPDGRYLAFRAAGGLFWTRSDGSGKPQPLTQSKNMLITGSFDPAGTRLVFTELNPEGLYGIWTVPVENDATGLKTGKPEVFLQGSFNALNPRFSPDGRWLAYTSTESGTPQVYVQAFPGSPSGPNTKRQVSNDGGTHPIFSRIGGKLFFRALDNRIMVASYKVKGDSFVADKPRVWSERRLAEVGLLRNYDVAADGKRIAALIPAEGREGQPQHHVVFLLNFFDELRRRVPVERP